MNAVSLTLCSALFALTACGGAVEQSRGRTGGRGVAVDHEAVEGVQADALEGLSGQPARRGRAHRKLKMTAARAERCADYLPLARAAAATHKVAPTLVMAVAWVESGFDPEAGSSAGAVGLMQLMPRTGEAMGCTDREDAACSLRGGSALLADLLRRHNGRVVYALCAYNAGSGRIRASWRAGKLPFNYWYAERVLAAKARLDRRGCQAD